MSEEVTAGQAGGQSMGSQEPTPSVSAGDVSNIGTKLHGLTSGQVALKNAFTTEPGAEPGQGNQPPANATATQQTPPAQTQQSQPVAKWDPAHENWLKSKGMDLTKFDPANDAHVQLVKNALSAESQMTKAIQAAKAPQQPPSPQTQPTPPAAPKQSIEDMSPLEQFDAIHKYEREKLLDRLRVTEQEFREARPDLWEEMNEEYRNGRQQAWEQTQEWKAEKSQRDAAKKSEETKFAAEMSRLTQAMENNLVVARSKNPQFDQVFSESGFDKLFDALDKTYALPKQFILSDPAILNLFVSAAEAIAYQKQEPSRKETWQQEYEAKVAKAKGAQLPPASANGNMMQQNSTIPQSAHWSQKLASAIVK